MVSASGFLEVYQRLIRIVPLNTPAIGDMMDLFSFEK